jgi:hypothetical protein
MVISGVAVALEGPNIWVKWHPQSAVLAEDTPLRIDRSSPDPFGQHGRKSYQFHLEQMSRDAKDIEVEGNIMAEEGYRFHFAALNSTYWRYWDEGSSYRAYVEAHNITTFSFVFNMTEKPLYNGLFFGVENQNDCDIRTRFSATISWKEKEIIEPAIATIGLFTLAKIIAAVGFILIIMAVVMKLRKLDERPYRAPGS